MTLFDVSVKILPIPYFSLRGDFVQGDLNLLRQEDALRDYLVTLKKLFLLSGVDVALFSRSGENVIQYHRKNVPVLDEVFQQAFASALEKMGQMTAADLSSGCVSLHKKQGYSFFSLVATVGEEFFLLLFGPFILDDGQEGAIHPVTLRRFSWGDLETIMSMFYPVSSSSGTAYVSRISDQKSEWEAGIPYNDKLTILHNAQTEYALMEAICCGDLEGIRKIVLHNSFMEPLHYHPSNDVLRNMKNISLSINTLCYHAACEGGCPTVYMRSIAARFAEQIELCHTTEELTNLRRDFALFYGEKVAAMKSGKYSIQMRSVVFYIHDHMAEDIRLSDIAEILSVSTGALSRRINREYGDSFSALVNNLRIQRACQYLNLAIPVSEVAERVGYKSSSQFCRHFREIKKMTPTEWREQNHMNIRHIES